jgi:hypothetical protein
VCTGSFRWCELRRVAFARVLRRSLTCSEFEQRFVRIFSVTVRCPAEDARRLFVCLFVTEFASYWPLSGREARNGGRGEAGGGGIVCLHIRASLERAHAKVVERLSRLKQAAHLKGAARVRLVDEWADDNNRFLGVRGVNGGT